MDNIYWEDVRKHQINSSSSKSTYAFPRQRRFRSTSKILCDSFYNIPSALGNSPKSGIGLGNKMEIVKKTCSPCPNKYTLTSEFDVSKKNLSLGKFSLGREKIKYNGIYLKNDNPSPGIYEVRTNLVLKNSISMHPKLSSPKKSYQFNPGPAHYTQLNTLNTTGRYIVSTVSNTAGTKIKQGKEFDRTQGMRKFPGPGAYNTEKQNMNVSGSFFNSKFENSRCRSFSRTSRDQKIVASKKKLPGPGAYNVFSDFGSQVKR